MNDQRLQTEVALGKHLSEMGKGQLWYWSTPAGSRRFKRRCEMLCAHLTPQMKVLEIGCSSGCLTKELAKTVMHITAIDISPDLLEAAKENVTASNVTFKIANAYDLDFKDQTFDSIVGSSVLHHLEFDRALKELFRVLKPGGTLYFTEPNYLNSHVFVERKVPFIRDHLNVAKHEFAFLRWKLHKDLKDCGFQNIRITPFDFLHPLTPQFLIPMVERVGRWVEATPLISEIAGSLYIRAEK